MILILSSLTFILGFYLGRKLSPTVKNSKTAKRRRGVVIGFNDFLNYDGSEPKSI